MAPKLYATDLSPASRAVLLTAKALGITLDRSEVSLLNMEHLEPKYAKINPYRTVPALDDDGTIICDSHVINTYLVQKYGKDDSLYPKDLKRRMLVDQRLYYDTGNVFAFLHLIIHPMVYSGEKTIPGQMKKLVEETYVILETILTGETWMAGKNVTIADFSLVSSMTSLDAFVPISGELYPNITAWIGRCQALPYYEENERGLGLFKALVEKLMT